MHALAKNALLNLYYLRIITGKLQLIKKNLTIYRIKAGLIDKLKQLAGRRKLDDMTLGPILTWNNTKIQEHINKVLQIPGAKLAFGGNPLTGHKIPSVYGAFEATAIFVPLKEVLDEKYYD